MIERFPTEVAEVLTEAGWSPERDEPTLAGAAVTRVERQFGKNMSRTESFPAAVAALREFAGVVVIQDGAGVDLRRRSFVFDPGKVAATTDTLADFGSLLDTRLFPLGFEGDHDSIIAIAESGHVFALDHTGEYHLGDSLDDALVLLIEGRLPARVDDSGEWESATTF